MSIRSFAATTITIVLVFLGLRMAALDTSISIESTYALPSLPDTKDLFHLNYGQQAIAVDGKITYKSSDEVPRPIASTAKMILALAVIQQKPFEKGQIGETITITPDYYNLYEWYIANNGSTTAVEIDEEISEYDALASVLMASSNNLADTLAIWAFGSIENYKNYAENMLNSWGIKNTTIGPDASGYSDNTRSTAEDLALVGYHLLENPVLAEIVSLKTHTVPFAGQLKNTNSLLGENGISGIKTGYGGDASGYCLVLGYFENRHIITTALLNADTRTASFVDSEAMVKSAQNTLTTSSIVQSQEPIGQIETWWGGKTNLISQDNFSTIAWKSDQNSSFLDLGLLQSGSDKIKLSTTAEISENVKMHLSLNGTENVVDLTIPDEYQEAPTIWQRFLRALGLI